MLTVRYNIARKWQLDYNKAIETITQPHLQYETLRKSKETVDNCKTLFVICNGNTRQVGCSIKNDFVINFCFNLIKLLPRHK